MERNLLHRVEVAFPIFHMKQIKRIRAELDMYLADNTQSWELDAQGNYHKLTPTKHRHGKIAQQLLLEKWSN
jgi:polyphosphate kinase